MVTATTTSRKDYNKIGTEDDPVIIAQRFLNIYRQLHIFSDERKTAFNRMILEQPAEIRGMFGSLPGGAVLQQYVDDLEAAAGINRNIPNGVFNSTEGNKPQILAEALADVKTADVAATSQAAAQAAAAAAAQAAAAVQAQLAAQSAIPRNTAPASGTATIVADKSFAKDIADALKEAIIYVENNRPQPAAQPQYQVPPQQFQTPPQAESAPTTNQTAAGGDPNLAREIVSALKEVMVSSDNQRRQESAQLAKAIVESQGKIAKMLVQNNTANNAANNNANNIQINTAASFPPVDEIVKGIAKTQLALFREMAQTQTKEISAIISVALKESQQLSSQSMIQAIREMQKENLKFLQMHPVAYTAAPQPQAVSETNIQMKTPDSQQEAAPAAKSRDETIPEISGDEVSVANVEAAGEASEELTAKKKKKKKKKKKNNSEGLGLDGFAASLMDKVSSLTDKVSSLSGKKTVEEKAPEEPAQAVSPLTAETESAFDLPADGGLDIDLFADEPEAPLVQESFADQQPILSEEEPLIEEVISADEDHNNQPTTEEPAQTLPAEEIAIFPDPILNASTETIAEEETVLAVESEETTPAVTPAIIEEPEAIPAPEEMFSEQISEVSENDGLTLSSENNQIDMPAEDFTDENLLFQPAEELSSLADNSFAEEPIQFEEAELNANDWGLSAASDQEIEEDLPLENPEEAYDGGEEWTYEELPSDEAEIADQPVAELSGEDSSEEWEWEYEEVPEDEAENTAQPVAEMSGEDGGEEWEWEYEEVPEDEAGNADQPVAELSGEDNGEEWEWEYEEVPEDEAENTDQPVAELSGEDGGEEWEWEYEEVPEDEAENADQPVAEMVNAPVEDVPPTGHYDLLKETAEADMYNISSSDADPYRPQESAAEEPQNNLSSIYTGEVYFQEQVYNQDTQPPALDIPQSLPGNLGITESDGGDAPAEPYKPQN